MATPEPCHCSAYEFPHRLGGGACQADGRVRCPNCQACLGDDQVKWVEVEPATRLLPPEYDPVVSPPCGCCGVEGAVP